jgi:hypothetical protein
MRFMLCARDRVSGQVTLVSDASFESRREAVEAVSGVRDFSAYSNSDIFLVDLEAAVPVAVVPWRPEAAQESEEPVASERPPAKDALEEPAEDRAVPLSEILMGVAEIDIMAWTCEDCIYITTCAKSGSLIPAECGSFQWRA